MALAFGSSLSRQGIRPFGPRQGIPYADMENSTMSRLPAHGMPALTVIAPNARKAGTLNEYSLRPIPSYDKFKTKG